MDPQSYQDNLTSLQRQNQDMKDLIQRLNSELRRYQLSGAEKPAMEVMDENIPPWAANTVFLAPLLLSYDSRIQELELALARSKTNLEELGEHAKRLTTENIHLRDQIDKRWHQLLQREKQDLQGGNVALAFHLQEKNQMQQRLDLLSTENNLLLQQLDALKSRHDYLQKLTVDRSKSAQTLLQQLKTLSSEFNQLKLEQQEIRAQKQIAENKLKRIQQHVGSIQREREQGLTTINRLQNQVRLSQQQATYYKKAYQDIDLKKTQQIQLLMQEAHNTSIREKDAINKTILQQRQCQDAKQQANYYKREFQSLRTQCDSMLKIMEDYEQKIATFQQKQDFVNQLARDSRQKVEEAILERDRCTLRESQYIRQIERLQQQLRIDLNQQKTKFQSLIEAMRKKNTALVASRDQELNSTNQKVYTLQLQVQRLQRDNSSYIADKDKAEALQADQQKRFNKRLDQYEKRMTEVQDLRLTEKRVLDSQNQQQVFERQEWERQKKKLEGLLHNSNKELESGKSSLKRNQDQLRRVRGQCEDMQRQRDGLVQELNLMRDSYYEKIQQASSEYNNKISQLEKQIETGKEYQKQSEEKAYLLHKAQEKISESWKKENLETMAYYQKVVEQLNDQIKNLATRNRELGDHFPVKQVIY